MKKEITLAELQKLKLKAQKKIDYFNAKEEFSIADQMALNEAEETLAEINNFLEPKQPVVRGLGGEIVPPSDSGKDGMALTVRNEDQTSVQASIERVELADKAGVYNLAFDAAEASNTQNPMEQMLIHQMSASHKHAMELLAKSTEQATVEQQALFVNASAKLMNTYQKAIQTLSKLKNNGKQIITVQHVYVSDNGQAIVNPNLKNGGFDGS